MTSGAYLGVELAGEGVSLREEAERDHGWQVEPLEHGVTFGGEEGSVEPTICVVQRRLLVRPRFLSCPLLISPPPR